MFQQFQSNIGTYLCFLASDLDPLQPALFLDCLNLLAGLGMTIVTTSLPRCAPLTSLLE